jgi:hypothetical protein
VPYYAHGGFLEQNRQKGGEPKRASALAIAGIALCFVSWASLFVYRSSVLAVDGERYFALFDDAMISMRYAWNLSHGSGLVWNPGEYVEGYTNPLWTLVMSPATFLFDKSGGSAGDSDPGRRPDAGQRLPGHADSGPPLLGGDRATRRPFRVLAFCARCRTTRWSIGP